MSPQAPVVEAALAPRVSGNAIVISALHLAAVAAAGILPLDAPPLSLLACPFRAMTGLPCLGCGCLHAFAAVAHLDIAAAFLANPLGALAAMGGICFAAGTALRVCGVRIPVPRLAPGRIDRMLRPAAYATGDAVQSPLLRAVRVAAVLAVLLNWSYVALRVAR